MSHFSVLVIGPDYDQQLAPFHEFECTGYDDVHVQELDRTEEARKYYDTDNEDRETFLDFVQGYYGSVPLYRGQPRDETHKYGFVEVDAEGNVLRVVKRTNPNKQWDWWLVGGRFGSFFPLKQGACVTLDQASEHLREGRANRVHKRDVDFSRARTEATARANETFSKWETIFTEHGQPVSWEDIRKKHEGDIDAARKEYNSQPAIEAWCKTPENHWRSEPVADMGFVREDYVARIVAKELTPFAILKDGKWSERGSMGWFGIVSDEMDDAQWCEQVHRLYDDLHDDTLLTIVDCHI